MNNELWLCIDSSKTLSISLHQIENRKLKLISEKNSTNSYDHSERFLELLEETLKPNNISINDIDKYFTIHGPGSFTGLRIAFSSLKAFSMVTQMPIYTVNGAEIRTLNFLKLNNVKNATIQVFTQISTNRFVLSKFIINSELTLLDEFLYSKKNIFDKLNGANVNLFDSEKVVNEFDLLGLKNCYFSKLSASLIAQNIEKSKTLTINKSFSEITNLSPKYYGSGFKMSFPSS